MVWTLLNKLFVFTLKTRLHVLGVFYFMCWHIIESYTNEKSNKYLPVIIVFTIWNYAIYLFDRAYDANLDYTNDAEESIKGKYTIYFLYFSILLTLMPIGILLYLKLSLFPYLIAIPFAFLYNIRIFPNQKAIKHYTLIKNLYSSIFIWTMPIAIILSCYVENPYNFIKVILWSWVTIIYITLGEIIWDMRDMKGDRIENIQTIPVRFGLKNTKIGMLLFLVGLFLPIQIYMNQFNLYIFIGFVIYIIISGPKIPKWIFHFPIFLSLFNELYKLIGPNFF